MFKFGISAQNIKFQKPNFSYRSSERVIHNERLFVACQKIDLNNLNMNKFIVFQGAPAIRGVNVNVPHIKKSLSFLENKNILL